MPPGNENCLNSFCIPSSSDGNIWIDLAVGTLQPGIRDDARSAVTRTREENDAEISFLDNAIEMSVDEIEARRSTRSPGLFYYQFGLEGPDSVWSPVSFSSWKSVNCGEDFQSLSGLWANNSTCHFARVAFNRRLAQGPLLWGFCQVGSALESFCRCGGVCER